VERIYNACRVFHFKGTERLSPDGLDLLFEIPAQGISKLPPRYESILSWVMLTMMIKRFVGGRYGQ